MCLVQAISEGNKEFQSLDRARSFVHRVTGSSKGLIHPMSRFSHAWKAVVSVSVLISVMEAPFSAVFTPMRDDGRITSFSEVLHLFYRMVVDLVFVADIWVNFRMGYIKVRTPPPIHPSREEDCAEGG